MPVQYTSQFIPTNVNLMNQMLNQKQQEHDMALARIAETEDKFGQMRVDPSDIEYKNQLLSGFQGDINNLVDQYDGDYGAASKDITRKLTKFRNDPFFQYAPYKAQLIEEARKREAQLGPYALNKRGVNELRSIQLNGDIDPDDFNYDIQDVRYIDPIVSGKAKEYATGRQYDINRKLGDSGYREIGSQLGFSDMNEAAQWLDGSPEGQEFLQSIYQQLGAQPGQYGVLDSRARDLALSNLVGQRKTNIVKDLNDINGGGTTIPGGARSPYTSSLAKGKQDPKYIQVKKDMDELETAYSEYQDLNKTRAELAGKYDLSNEAVDAMANTSVNVDNNGRKSVVVPRDKSSQKSFVEAYTKIFGNDDVYIGDDGMYKVKDGIDTNKVKENIHSMQKMTGQGHKTNTYQRRMSAFDNDPTFNDLVDAGVEKMDAARYVTNEKHKMYMQFSEDAAPTDMSDITGKLRTYLISNPSDFEGVIDPTTNKEVKSKDLKESLAKGNVEVSEFNLMDGVVKLTVKEGDEFKHYNVPAKNIKNSNLSTSIDNYKSFLNDVYSQSDTKSSNFKIGGLEYVYDSEPNKNYSKELEIYKEKAQQDPTIQPPQAYHKTLKLRFDQGNGIEEYTFNNVESGMADFAQRANTSLVDNLGTLPVYTKRKR